MPTVPVAGRPSACKASGRLPFFSAASVKDICIHAGDSGSLRNDRSPLGWTDMRGMTRWRFGPVGLRLSTTEDGHVLTNGARLDFTGIERIHLTDGGDKVNGGAAAMDRHPLSIYSYGGDDTINGGAGGDFIDPGAGDDKVFAGAGDDFVQASPGST